MKTAVQSRSEHLISVLLKKNNYYNVVSYEKYIFADSALRNILLLVTSVQDPSQLILPSDSEVTALKKKALELKREAWVAIVSINGDEIGAPIKWYNHSKR